MVWPLLRTSSWASSSPWSSTSAANRRSSRARSPGATARQDSKAVAARAIAASVSAREVAGTSATTCSVTGEITDVMDMTSQPLEAADQFPVGDRGVERGQFDAGVVGVVRDDLVAEGGPGGSAVFPQVQCVAQGRRDVGR